MTNALGNLANRPGWDQYFMGIAEAVSRRSDCIRDQVGAVVVGADKRIRSTGYNGAPAGIVKTVYPGDYYLDTELYVALDYPGTIDVNRDVA